MLAHVYKLGFMGMYPPEPKARTQCVLWFAISVSKHLLTIEIGTSIKILTIIKIS